MAIANIIAKGIGFSPGSTKWIPTHGFGSAEIMEDPLLGLELLLDYDNTLAVSLAYPNEMIAKLGYENQLTLTLGFED